MALAQQLTASGRGVSGSAFFTEGMQSAPDPMFISDRSCRHAENVLHRGGAMRTRPGYRQIFTLPAGKLQGLTYFRPLSGEGHLVVAVAGKLYQSSYPFTSYTRIPNVQLYAYAARVWFSVSIRTAERNADGTIQAIEPKRTLIAQDGAYTRAAYWDGTASGHSDPTVTYDADSNRLTAGIPLGGPTKQSGGRLWVAQRNKLFAGDVEDPLSFVENQYLAEGGFFVFDDDITALEEIPSLSDPVLLVFTKSKTHKILSGIRARDTWKDTKNFQSTLFPDIGCASQRGVVTRGGLVWWMSATGLTNLNAAQQEFISSKLVPLDNAMAISKSNIAPDLSVVALGAYENFLLCSVPYADKYNRHTWVLDQSVVTEGPAASESWAGVWTGTRPVEWASGIFGGVPRVMHISKDYNGQNRLWEAFVPSRKDNGEAIQSFVETKTHIDFSPKATGLDLKTLVFAEVTLADILGDVAVEVYWAGTRGKYKLLAEYNLEATVGSLEATTVITTAGGVSTYRGQQRILRLPVVKQDPAAGCSSCGVESKNADWLDVGFSLLIKWTGQAALRSYRIFVDPRQESGTGEAQFDEAVPNVLEGAIC